LKVIAVDEQEIKDKVREGYAKVANTSSSCCAPATPSCCGDSPAENVSKLIGYSPEELDSVPELANMGLGCGNPVALASLAPGETVLDLGSGPGMDCFLSAKRVGPEGKVIGVDMTPEMLDLARRNAEDYGLTNVEFRQGEIEDLPVEDASVDVIISNCVINLSPDKEKVFKEAFRVLKPGGRLMVSDIVLLKELPEFIRKNVTAYIGCVSGAMMKDEYLGLVEEAGFDTVEIRELKTFSLLGTAVSDDVRELIGRIKAMTPAEILDLAGSIASMSYAAYKPA
jgi:SAM-dependent methyltransferase